MLYTVILFCVTHFRSAACDSAMDWIHKQGNIFHKDSAKKWNAYSENILQQNIVEFLQGRKVTFSMSRFLLFSKALLFKFQNYEFELGLKSFKTFQKQRDRYIKNLDEYWNLQMIFNVTRPTGALWVNGTLQPSQNRINQMPCHNSFTYDKTCYSCHRYSSFTWKFSVASVLSLNVSFTLLEFISSPVNFLNASLPCFFGAVEISREMSTETKFTFCGQHSNFSIFPTFASSYFTTKAFPSTIFHVHLYFIVMDQNEIQTTFVNKPKFYLYCDVPIVSHLLQQKHIFYVHTIKILMQYKLIITPIFNDNVDYNVVDGPGFLCRKVYPHKQNYMLSGFYAIVQTHFRSNEFGRYVKICYKTSPRDWNTIYINNGTEIKLPNKQFCNSFICAFEIISNLHLNISVFDLQCEGKQSEDCKYAGLTVEPETCARCVKIPILCKSYTGDETQKRSFYSSDNFVWNKNHTILVVLYHYRAYSKIVATLYVETTSCTPYYHNSDGFLFDNRIQHFMQRNPFIKIRYYLRWEKQHREYRQDSVIFVSVPQNTCVVFQINRYIRGSDIVKTEFAGETFNYCLFSQTFSFGFASDILFGPNQNFLVTESRGVLRQNVNNKSLWKSCMYRCEEINQVILRETEIQTKISQTKPDDVEFYLKSEDRFQFLRTGWELWIEEPFSSQNWIEIKFVSKSSKFVPTAKFTFKNIFDSLSVSQVSCSINPFLVCELLIT